MRVCARLERSSCRQTHRHRRAVHDRVVRAFMIERALGRSSPRTNNCLSVGRVDLHQTSSPPRIRSVSAARSPARPRGGPMHRRQCAAPANLSPRGRISTDLPRRASETIVDRLELDVARLPIFCANASVSAAEGSGYFAVTVCIYRTLRLSSRNYGCQRLQCYGTF